MRKPLQTPTLQTLGGSRDMSSYHTSSQECSLIASFSGCMTGRQVTVLQCELSNLPTQSLDMGGKKILYAQLRRKMEISFMNPLLISPR